MNKILCRTIPKNGKFVACWPQPNGYTETIQCCYRNGVLMAWDDTREGWEEFSEANGYFGIEDAFFIQNSDFIGSN